MRMQVSIFLLAELGSPAIPSDIKMIVLGMSILTLFKQCFQVVGMVLTVWVVTWFEIVQGFMQNANVAFLFTSVGLGAMTVQVIKYIKALPEEINPPETTVLWILFGLSGVCVVTALAGFYGECQAISTLTSPSCVSPPARSLTLCTLGAWVEHSTVLLVYALVTGMLALAHAAMLILTSVVDIGAVISENCHDVLLLIKESW